LRVLGGIAVHFARRCLKDLGLQSLGKTEHVYRAVYAGFGGLHRIELVMDRRRRTRHVVDLVDFDVERECDVVANQLEVRVRQERHDIVARPGEEIVHAKHVVPILEQAFTQVRTEKSRTAGDQQPLA